MRHATSEDEATIFGNLEAVGGSGLCNFLTAQQTYIDYSFSASLFWVAPSRLERNRNLPTHPQPPPTPAPNGRPQPPVLPPVLV